MPTNKMTLNIMHLALLICASCASFSSLLAQPVLQDFANYFGNDFINSEQVLSSTTPLLSHPGNLAGRIVPAYGLFEGLAEEYRPASQNVFKMIVLLIPEDQVHFTKISNGISNLSFLNIQMNEKKYFHFFIHPNEQESYSDLINKHLKSEEEWFATPTSSMRSLMVLNKDKTKGFIAKTSMHRQIGRYTRVIQDERAIRSVVVSDIFQSIINETNGILDGTNITWTYFPEPLSLIPNGAEGAFIAREVPDELRENIVISWFALIANSPQGRWIDRLYKASNYTNKKDFVWNELVYPLLRLHIELSLKNGLTTELHQQNTLLVIDPRTLKIKKLAVRDMDSHLIDHSLRRTLGKTLDLNIPFEQQAELFRYGFAQKNHWHSYSEKLRTESLEWILSQVLNPFELSEVLYMADNELLKSFNAFFPNFAVHKPEHLPEAFKKLHNAITSPYEILVYGDLDRKYTSTTTSDKLLNFISSTSSLVKVGLNWKYQSLCQEFF